MRWAADQIIGGFGLDADATDQVIEGTPGQTFEGRMTLKVNAQDRRSHTAYYAGKTSGQPLDAMGPDLGAEKGKVSLR